MQLFYGTALKFLMALILLIAINSLARAECWETNWGKHKMLWWS